MITSPSGKVYIGQSVDIKRRIKRYKYFGAIEQPYLHRSLLKYGFDNHNVEILIECQRDELNSKETELIEKYNSFNPIKGMNLTSGGKQNWRISEETRIKMRNRPKRTYSEETKNKIRIAHLGKKKNYENPRKGVKLSDETKNKIRANHSHSKPMLGKKHTKKTKLKIGNSRRGKPAKNRRPIIDIYTGIVYSYKGDAAIALGINVRTLKAKLEGKLTNNTPLRYA